VTRSVHVSHHLSDRGQPSPYGIPLPISALSPYLNRIALPLGPHYPIALKSTLMGVPIEKSTKVLVNHKTL
jgi:hypothetical protein